MRKRNKKIKNKGLAFLPTILIIGIIITELGIALSFVVYLSNFSAYSFRLSQEAFFAARTGVNDAILRVSRDKTFPLGFSDYNMSLGRAEISITIEKNTPAVNQDRITSIGSVLNRQRRIRAIIAIDSETDKVSLISLNEI